MGFSKRRKKKYQAEGQLSKNKFLSDEKKFHSFPKFLRGLFFWGRKKLKVNKVDFYWRIKKQGDKRLIRIMRKIASKRFVVIYLNDILISGIYFWGNERRKKATSIRSSFILLLFSRTFILFVALSSFKGITLFEHTWEWLLLQFFFLVCLEVNNRLYSVRSIKKKKKKKQ